MSQIHSMTVILEKPLHQEDAEALKETILWLRGVGSVKLHEVTVGSEMAFERARQELEAKVLKILRDR